MSFETQPVIDWVYIRMQVKYIFWMYILLVATNDEGDSFLTTPVVVDGLVCIVTLLLLLLVRSQNI